MTAIRRARFSDLEFITELEAREDMAAYILRWKRSRHHVNLADEDKRYLIIEDQQARRRGFAVLSGITDEHGVVELTRIIVDQPGQGLGRRFLRAIKEFVFAELSAHRLWVDVFSDNERAQHVYRSEGFVEEGRLRDAVRDGATRRSLIVMSMLAHEYGCREASGF